MSHKSFVYIGHMIRSIRRAALRPSSSGWTRTAYKAGLTSIYQPRIVAINHCNIAINKKCILNRWGFSSSSPWDLWLLSSFMRSSTGYHHYHHVENSCSVLLLFRDHKHMVFNCTSHGPITLPQMPTGDQTENIAEKQSPGSGDSGQWGHLQISSPAKTKTFWPFWSTWPLISSSWPRRLNSGESLTAVEKSQILFFLVFFLQPLRPATMKKS